MSISWSKRTNNKGKGKGKLRWSHRIDFRSDRYSSNRPWRDFARQSKSTTTQVVSTMFREPVHQILEKIKSELYFKWPNKMGGDLTKHN